MLKLRPMSLLQLVVCRRLDEGAAAAAAGVGEGTVVGVAVMLPLLLSEAKNIIGDWGDARESSEGSAKEGRFAMRLSSSSSTTVIEGREPQPLSIFMLERF